MQTFLSISLIFQNTKLTKTTKWNYCINRGQIKIEYSPSHTPHSHPSFLPTATRSIAATLQDLMWHPPMSKLNINQWWQHSETIRKPGTQISGSSLVKRTRSAGQGLDLYFPSPDNCIPPAQLSLLYLLIPEWMWICFFNNIKEIVKKKIVEDSVEYD